MKRIVSLSFAVWTVLSSLAARADEAVYFEVPLAELKISEGTRDGERPIGWSDRMGSLGGYRILLDNGGEAYINTDVSFNPTGQERPTSVVVRRDEPGEVTGRYVFPKEDDTFGVVKFTIAADRASPAAHAAFLEGKSRFYRGLIMADSPGGAWFRHQARVAEDELKALRPETPQQAEARQADIRQQDFDDTYNLFSGGRAISENLQLDREMLLPQTGETQETVKLDTLQGITIAEIDWKPLLEGKSPELDPLADVVPADQHVVFFPHFEAMTRMSDEIERQGTVLLQSAEPRNEDSMVLNRYQTQLGLTLSGLGRMLGPSMIKSVAITGGDPYFRVGTDVAVIIEPVDKNALALALTTQIGMAAAEAENVEKGSGQVLGVDYVSWRSPDRYMSCYLVATDQCVIVTNSLAQLERLVETQQGKTPAISSLDEYKFFRSRYPLSTPGETAFVFLSDPTIRRWCGPRWRIASSRRTRDLAVLSELQASLVPDLLEMDVQEGPLTTTLSLSVPGELTADSFGVVSSTLGTIECMTPISELKIDEVSKAEAEAYERWKNGYESNWSWAFDPIGVQIVIDDDKLAADMTVMPLIAGSDYRDFMSVSQGVALDPYSGDPHETLAHFILAINKDSQPLQQGSAMAMMFAPQLRVDVLGWLGNSVSLYVEDGPIWHDLMKIDDDRERDELLETRFTDLPVAINIEVSSAFKATAFLTALRGFIDQVGPGMVKWESIDEDGYAYVKVSPSERAIQPGQPGEKVAIFYALTSEALTISPHEPLIKRVLDRQKARDAAAAPGATPAAEPTVAWLGKNLCVNISDTAMQGLWRLSSKNYQQHLQQLSWSNLPILNEWHRLAPEIGDDAALEHARMWGVMLECPGGGEYVWNDKWQTMESTVFGHPGKPKLAEVPVPTLLEDFSGVRAGVTFEADGLRAKAELKRRKE